MGRYICCLVIPFFKFELHHSEFHSLTVLHKQLHQINLFRSAVFAFHLNVMTSAIGDMFLV